MKDCSLAEKPLGGAGQAAKAKAKATGERVYVDAHVRRRPTPEVLAELVPPILRGLAWAKTMRWGSGTGPWVRPVHGVVALLRRRGRCRSSSSGSRPATRRSATRSSRRSRSRSPTARDYRAPARRARHRGALRAAPSGFWRGDARARRRAGRRAGRGPELLDKLAAICEIPGVMEGAFDRGAAARCRARCWHQPARPPERLHGRDATARCCRCSSPSWTAPTIRSGGCAPATSGWSRRGSPTRGSSTTRTARRRSPSAPRGSSSSTFHEKLGSYAEKARGWRRSPAICAALGWSDRARRAARRRRALLKVDSTTEMVKEFTSLQGVMGGIYAREEGQPEAVWQAIYDQYLPASTERSRCRAAAVGSAVGARRPPRHAGRHLRPRPGADRQQGSVRPAPRGAGRGADRARRRAAARRSSAPVAPRRGALRRPAEAQTPTQILADLRPFLADRLRYLLGLQGYAYDEIEAALAAPTERATCPTSRARVAPLHQVRGEPAFLSVVQAAKRIANILKGQPAHALDAARSAIPPSARSTDAARRASPARSRRPSARREYERALRRIDELPRALDRFFVEVLVMDPDPAVRATAWRCCRRSAHALAHGRITEMVVEKAATGARGAEPWTSVLRWRAGVDRMLTAPSWDVAGADLINPSRPASRRRRRSGPPAGRRTFQPGVGGMPPPPIAACLPGCRRRTSLRRNDEVSRPISRHAHTRLPGWPSGLGSHC